MKVLAQVRYFFFLTLALVTTGVLVAGPAFAVIPRDPKAEQLSYQLVNAYQAWDKTTGSRNVVVAVVDNGFDTFHPDLADNVWKNPREIEDNGIDDDRNGFVDDVWGWNFVKRNNDPRPHVLDLSEGKETYETIHHATIIAGIIGSVANNNTDGAGIAWNVLLMNVKAVESTGSGETGPLVEGIRYAVDNGAHVINISIVGSTDPEVRRAVQYAHDRGVAVIAAVGNERFNLDASPAYPACADAGQPDQWVLGVSAVDEQRFLARFSNSGSSCVDLTAPGVNISGPIRYAPQYGLNESYKSGWRGTSFAAPFVTGAAALIKSLQPGWGPKEIYAAILQNVHRTQASYDADPAAYTAAYGAGFLQIDKAVTYAAAQAPAAAPAPIPVSPVVPVVNQSVTLVVGSMGQATPVWLDGTKKGNVKDTVWRGAESAAAFMNDDTQLFAVVRRNVRNQKEIAIVDAEGKMQKNWRLPSSAVQWQIVAGNILANGEMGVAVVPVGPARDVYIAYDLSGKERSRLTLRTNHTGVALTLTGKRDGIQQLVAAYRERGVLAVRRFASDGSITQTIPVENIKTVGAIGMGDIDGNGSEEYILTGGKGDDPVLVIHNDDGSFRRRFLAYESGLRSGLRLVVGDIDGDGKAEMIVAPTQGKLPVVVWSARAKRVQEWWPLGEGKELRTTLFVPIIYTRS